MASKSTFSVIIFARCMVMTIVNDITTDNHIRLFIRFQGFINCKIKVIILKVVIINRLIHFEISYNIVNENTDHRLDFCTTVSVTRISRQTLTNIFLFISDPR